MRHDDTIRTAVALAERDSPDARAAAFRQLIDLSLQRRDCADARLRRRALRALSRLSRDVPESLRNAMIDKAARAGARSLHLRLFRGHVSHHYDRMLQVAHLDEPEWWRLARRAPKHLHAGMLSRRDLPGPVRELLSGRPGAAAGGGAERLFVPDAAIAATPAAVVDKARFAPAMQPAVLDEPAAPALESGRSQIKELLDRISAFRSRGHEPEQGEAAEDTAEPRESPVEELERRWTWRCDEQGILIESPATPPQLVGHWLVEFDTPDGSGQGRRRDSRGSGNRSIGLSLLTGRAPVRRENLHRLPGRGRHLPRLVQEMAVETADGDSAPGKVFLERAVECDLRCLVATIPGDLLDIGFGRDTRQQFRRIALHQQKSPALRR